MKRHSLFGWLGAGAAVVIVVASVLVRLSGPADPAADVGDQRADVERFHDLVRAGRWLDVYTATTEPPAKNAQAFAELMRDSVEKAGAVTDVTIESLRLLRSRTVPMLEVRETVTMSKDGVTRRERTISYFARKGDRWLFAFSAPA
jgi:hypothetical protein